MVLRLAADGSLDTSFGTGGQILVPAASANDLVLLPNGDFVLATESTTTDSITLGWYGPTGAPASGIASVGEGGYGGVLPRSDSSVLVGTYKESGQQLSLQA